MTARQADAEGLIDELARAFDTAETAEQLLWEAELNPWIAPDPHCTDRRNYWRRACQAAEGTPSGIRCLLAEAAWLRPGNIHFQRFAPRVDRVTRAIAAALDGSADPSHLLYDVLDPGLRPDHLPGGTRDGKLRRIVRTCFRHARNPPMQELATAIRRLGEATAQRIIDELSAEGLLQHGDDPGHASWNRAESPRPYVWICRRQFHVPRYDDKIREQLAHQPVWLWGPRHYGKTWTIRCIGDQFDGRAELCILDVSDFAEIDRETAEAFLREAGRRIGDQLLGTSAPQRPRSDAPIAPAARFERQLAGLIHERRIRYLLLAIDEIQDLSPRARVAVLSALVGYHCSAGAMAPLSPDRFGLVVGSRGNPFELLPPDSAAALTRKCHILEIEEFDATGGEVVALAEKFEHQPAPGELAQIAACVSGHPSLLGQVFARWRQDDELPALSDRDVRRRVFERELDELRRLLADRQLADAFLRIARGDATDAVGQGAMTALRDLGLVSRDGRAVSCGLYRDLMEVP